MKQLKFKFQEVRPKGNSINNSLCLCAPWRDLNKFNKEAYRVEMTDVKRKSQYHMEDMLSMQHGNALIVYFRNEESHFINARFNNKPIRVAGIQREMGIGGETVTIG